MKIQPETTADRVDDLITLGMQTRSNLAESWTRETAPKPHQVAADPHQNPHQVCTKRAEPQFERFWFTYRGREWRLFKRGAGPKAKWYVYIEFKGKRLQHCCGEVERRAAEATAKIKIDSVLDDHKDTLRASMLRRPEDKAANCCTLQQLTDAYEGLSLNVDPVTQHRNANNLHLVVRKAQVVAQNPGAGKPELLKLLAEAVDQHRPVGELASSALDDRMARRYFEAVTLQANAAGDQVTAGRVKRTGNSIFNQARSILRPYVLARLRDRGLKLPDFAPFVGSFKEERFEGVSQSFNAPAETIVRKTLHDWLTLPRNEFIAAGLELSCGLRKAEAQQVTWAMFTRNRDGALLDGRGKVKNATGAFVCVPIDPYWKLLNRRIDREGWRGEPGELVLIGTKTDIEDNIFRAVGTWLRDMGWETVKTNHALRAYAGSLVAMKFGIHRASAWLRHQSVKVTEKHYMKFLNERVFRPELVRIRWGC